MVCLYAARTTRHILRNTLRARVHSRNLHYTSKVPPHPPTLPEAHGVFQDLIDHALQLSHSVFDYVHVLTGTPWALTIPLVAVAFRLAYSPVLYLVNRDQSNLTTYAPLMVAWRHNIRNQAKIKFPPTGDSNIVLAEKWTEQQMARKRNEFGTIAKPKFGKHMALTLSFLPIWIVNMDTIRRMAGLDNTLLASVWGAADKLDRTVVPADPTLATEGILWFPDLTIADPTMILPLSFGLATFANWWYGLGKTDKQRQQTLKDPQTSVKERASTYRTHIFSRVILGFALLSSPVLIYNEVPSGVCLFLTASAVTMLAQRPVIRNMMRLKQQMQMARPLLPKMKGVKGIRSRTAATGKAPVMLRNR